MHTWKRGAGRRRRVHGDKRSTGVSSVSYRHSFLVYHGSVLSGLPVTKTNRVFFFQFQLLAFMNISVNIRVQLFKASLV